MRSWQVQLEHALLFSFCTAHVFLWARRRQRKLLCGASVGPIIEEVVFRGAAFSVIYVTACSIKLLAHWRIGLSTVGSSLLFVWCHTRAIGIPWMVIFSMVCRLCSSPLAIQFRRDVRAHARDLQLCDCDRNDSRGWCVKGLSA